jgi:hypothetical protein
MQVNRVKPSLAGWLRRAYYVHAKGGIPKRRIAQAGARPPATHLVREQDVAHVALAQPNAVVERELDREQLERPGRPMRAEVLRRASM